MSFPGLRLPRCRAERGCAGKAMRCPGKVPPWVWDGSCRPLRLLLRALAAGDPTQPAQPRPRSVLPAARGPSPAPPGSPRGHRRAAPARRGTAGAHRPAGVSRAAAPRPRTFQAAADLPGQARVPGPGRLPQARPGAVVSGFPPRRRPGWLRPPCGESSLGPCGCTRLRRADAGRVRAGAASPASAALGVEATLPSGKLLPPRKPAGADDTVSRGPCHHRRVSWVPIPRLQGKFGASLFVHILPVDPQIMELLRKRN